MTDKLTTAKDEEEPDDRKPGDLFGFLSDANQKAELPPAYFERHKRIMEEDQAASDVVTPEWTFPPELFYGIRTIKDMATSELIEELIRHQRGVFGSMDRDELMQTVANSRLMSYRRRLAEECGVPLHGTSWPFG